MFKKKIPKTDPVSILYFVSKQLVCSAVFLVQNNITKLTIDTHYNESHLC